MLGYKGVFIIYVGGWGGWGGGAKSFTPFQGGGGRHINESFEGGRGGGGGHESLFACCSLLHYTQRSMRNMSF